MLTLMDLIPVLVQLGFQVDNSCYCAGFCQDRSVNL